MIKLVKGLNEPDFTTTIVGKSTTSDANYIITHNAGVYPRLIVVRVLYPDGQKRIVESALVAAGISYGWFNYASAVTTFTPNQTAVQIYREQDNYGYSTLDYEINIWF